MSLCREAGNKKNVRGRKEVVLIRTYIYVKIMSYVLVLIFTEYIYVYLPTYINEVYENEKRYQKKYK